MLTRLRVLAQASILSNYQFDKYLSSGKDDNGEDKLKLPLEKIYLDASAEFQKVGSFSSSFASALLSTRCFLSA